MRYARVSTGATVVLLAFTMSCSTAEPRAGVTSPQGAAIQEQDRGWAALVEADRQVKVLQGVRESMEDPLFKDAVTHQIEMIVARSNALLDEMSAADGRVHDAQIRRRAADLQRAVGVGAAEMQGRP